MIARRILGCVCPSEILREELEARGWTERDLADHVYEPGTQEWSMMVLAAEMYLACGPVSLAVRIGTFADELGKAFGVSGDFWRALETAWLENSVERDEREVVSTSTAHGPGGSTPAAVG